MGCLATTYRSGGVFVYRKCKKRKKKINKVINADLQKILFYEVLLVN